MPWIVKQSPKCPGYKPWGVFNQQTGAKEGCHPSKEAATQQQKALYAKEPQMNSADDCECQSNRGSRRAERLRSLAEHLRRAKQPELAARLSEQARQQDETEGDWDEEPGHLAQAVDAILDEALEAFAQGDVDQGVALTVGAAATLDQLLESLNLPDADESDGSPGMAAPLGEGMNSADLAALNSRAPTKAPYGNVTYADPGYQSDGKKRYPIDSAAHVKAAWSYINQTDNASQYTAAQLARIKARIKAAAKKFGIQIGDNANSVERPGELFRAMPFELVPHGDGLTLEGYAAVFNSPARISGWEGDFEEQIAPGAFARTLRERTPVLMFEHGKHPLIGSMPLGVIRQASEDTKGVHVEARLSDNWLIQPVRDAVRDGAVTGMSFRFSVPDGGDTWMERKDSLPLRTLTDVDVRELGPVVFPAYEPTTAYVRSALDRLSETAGQPAARSAGGGVLGRLPRNPEATPALLSALQSRDRELRIRGIIRA